MAISHGMSVEAVEEAGRLLQTRHAERLRALVAEIDRQVAACSATWIGPDAERFRGWWPEKRARAMAMAEDLHGFGQSALNNAAEQRSASGGEASASSAAPAAPVQPGQPPQETIRTGATGEWGSPISKAAAKEIVDRYIPASERHIYDWNDRNGTGDDWYQCTTWAKARWQDMGYDGPMWRGDGGEVAHNINAMLGRPDSNVATLGAIVSDSSVGHVAVVEEIRPGPGGTTEIRVSEMNYGGNGWQQAYASEFRDDRWIKVGSGHTFAAFPT